MSRLSTNAFVFRFKCLDNFHWKYNLHLLEHQFWKRVYQDWDESQESRWKKMSVVAIICEHYKGTWWRMAFLINVASSIVTNIAFGWTLEPSSLSKRQGYCYNGCHGCTSTHPNWTQGAKDPSLWNMKNYQTLQFRWTMETSSLSKKKGHY